MKVAIVGILPRQLERLKGKCPGFEIVAFERWQQAVGRRFGGSQWAIVTRHCDHEGFKQAQMVLGADHVFRLRATGESSILSAFATISGRNGMPSLGMLSLSAVRKLGSSNTSV